MDENTLKFIKQDVTDAASWEKVVEDTEKIFGQVNILVNNAGISINKPLLEITEDEYRKMDNSYAGSYAKSHATDFRNVLSGC